MHTINVSNEKKVINVVLITLITMFAEIFYGYTSNSMALLADGFHMGTHVLALGLTYAAYVITRKCEKMDIFKSGPDKIGTLAGYTSAIFLALTGIWVIFEAVFRFFRPENIAFNEAIIVAIIGFVVNFVCILIMHKNHEHEHDYNFISAYYHILADALTSLLAIGALLTAKYLQAGFLDPLVGIIGGVLILRWSVSLIKDTTKILIDLK